MLVVVDRGCCRGGVGCAGRVSRRWTSGPGSASRPTGGGFNPCCGGSGSLTRRYGTSGGAAETSFNPCCRGSGSLTGARGPVPSLGGDVSILVVVDRGR